MKIIFDEDDIAMVAAAMAKSRGMGEVDFTRPFPADGAMGDIYREAARVVVAFRNKYGS